ncbi:sodium-dependent phosphate transporter, partial [Bacillus spizizenii]|nr:sodium-dependent phosphate transporter [Bacillus spizizenii]
SVAARRAAATHVLFNLIGTTILLILLKPFTALILSLQTSIGLDPKMTIAFAHGIFNTTNTIIQLHFVGILALIVTKLIPGKDSMVEY